MNNKISFCGKEYLFDNNIIHNYLLEKGIVISMMNDSTYNLEKKFDIINNTYELLIDISKKIDDDTIIDDEYKFLENCCDELINIKIVNIAKKYLDYSDKKNRLIKLLDEVENLASIYPNLRKYLNTDVLKINNIIDDIIIYKLIAN